VTTVAVALDAGGSKIAGGLVTPGGEVSTERRVATEGDGVEQTCDLIDFGSIAGKRLGAGLLERELLVGEQLLDLVPIEELAALRKWRLRIRHEPCGKLNLAKGIELCAETRQAFEPAV